MLKIGITGGIGSGKTIVCDIFKNLNIPIFIADIQAKLLLIDDKIKENLLQLLGDDILTNDQIDNEKLAKLIFNNKTILQTVNSIIHPAVALKFTDWINWHGTAPYVIIESAILFETKINFNLHYMINVTAPLELRISRIASRNNFDKDSIMARINNQITEEERCKRADAIIYNDESQLLIPQILELHNKFIQENLKITN